MLPHLKPQRGQRQAAATHLRDHLTEAGHDVGAFRLLVVREDPRQNNNHSEHSAQVHLGDRQGEASIRKQASGMSQVLTLEPLYGKARDSSCVLVSLSGHKIYPF